MTVMNDFI